MDKLKSILIFSFSAAIFLISCSKNTNDPINPNTPYTLSYGDSIFYLRNQPGDYIIFPADFKPGGRYTGFPEGIEINEQTGAINISKSETGLRYKISYTDSTTGLITTTTTLLISGINYFDKIYNLSSGDTLAMPVYNATSSNAVPAHSVFDEGKGCNGVGVAVDLDKAVINLAQTIRNGVFGTIPANDSKKEVELKYRVNDGSNKTLNALKVKLYYFKTANDITPDLIQLLKDREGTVFGSPSVLKPFDGQITSFGSQGPSGIHAVAKPRPPCIFIVGRL
ncbi:MAG: hypothetical protein ACKVOW_18815 [Chitinophagaceae bacterium]